MAGCWRARTHHRRGRGKREVATRRWRGVRRQQRRARLHRRFQRGGAACDERTHGKITAAAAAATTRPAHPEAAAAATTTTARSPALVPAADFKGMARPNTLRLLLRRASSVPTG